MPDLLLSLTVRTVILKGKEYVGNWASYGASSHSTCGSGPATVGSWQAGAA